MSDAPLDLARAEATSALATALRRVIAGHVAAHGVNDPQIMGIVAGAIALCVAELTTHVDPSFGPIVATMLLRDHALTAPEPPKPET